MSKKPKRSTQKNKADRLFSEQVRARGRCEAAGLDEIKCAGMLQCCHVLSRRYHALRWSPLNALCMCQAHHTHYTHREWDWRDFVQKHFPKHYRFVQAHRNDVWDKDLVAVLERLKGL